MLTTSSLEQAQSEVRFEGIFYFTRCIDKRNGCLWSSLSDYNNYSYNKSIHIHSNDILGLNFMKNGSYYVVDGLLVDKMSDIQHYSEPYVKKWHLFNQSVLVKNVYEKIL